MPTIDDRVADLLTAPHFERAAVSLASGFAAIQHAAPRLTSLFSTQQRWLMSHVALALYFRATRTDCPGLSLRTILDELLPHGLVSRNTVAAYFSELRHYGIIRPVASTGFVEPDSAVLTALAEWFRLHLAALDMLDGRDRVALLRRYGEGFLAEIEPAVADALVRCTAIRMPPPIYALFAHIDDGGSLMDRLMLGLEPGTCPRQERASTPITSVSTLAHGLNLSRTHAGRILATAMAAGALGWSGRPGRSPIWLSPVFRAEYARMQATKLAIIDAALASFARGTETAMPAGWSGEDTAGGPPGMPAWTVSDAS